MYMIKLFRNKKAELLLGIKEQYEIYVLRLVVGCGLKGRKDCVV